MNKSCFIAVTNRNLCKRPFFDVIEDLSKKDVKTIVLREKDLSEEEYYEIAEKCKEICDRNGASLTIHNFIDVARRLGIKKIHLPYPVFLKESIFDLPRHFELRTEHELTDRSFRNVQ